LDVLDLSRLRGLLTGVGLVAALAIVLMFKALPALLQAWMTRLDEANRTSPLVSYQTFGQKLVALAREGPGTPGAGRIGMTLGSSQCIDAVDTTRLSAAPAAEPTRWFSGCGLGVNLVDLALMTDLLLRTPVRPDRVLIGLDRGMIAKVKVKNFWYDEQPAPKWTEVLEHLGREPRLLLGDLVQGLRFLKHDLLPYKEATLRHFPVELFDLRMRLFTRLGISPLRLFPPHAEPWGRDFGPGQQIDEAVNLKLIENQRAMGRFDAANYVPDGPNVRALVGAIGRLKAAGVVVVIMMLPEESRVRALLPPKSLDVLRDALTGAFGAAAPPILDLRATVPDDQFEDLMHVDKRGRARVTELLLRTLPPPG
jgi:hypothetical protein